MSQHSSANPSARTAILDRLRTRLVDSPPLPDMKSAELIDFEDRELQFCEMVRLVGGTCHQVKTPAEVEAILSELTPFREAKRVISTVPDWLRGNADMAQYDDPHSLRSLDWLITKGHFGVAENGAIWMDFSNTHHRASLFLTQYLAILVPASTIVPHMHAAYERIAQKPYDSFGLFVSGPSKTADIEQSLVLGAHGCRTLNVFVVDDMP